MAGVDVLHDDDDGAEVGGQAAQQLGQRRNAAGRGGDGDYVEGLTRSRRNSQSGLRLRPPCISATRNAVVSSRFCIKSSLHTP